MKKENLIKSSFVDIAVLSSFALCNCSSDDEAPSVTKSQELLPDTLVRFSRSDSIFKELLPSDGSQSRLFYFGVVESSDTILFINSKAEFLSACPDMENLPDIDFDRSTLVVGKIYATAGTKVDIRHITRSEAETVVTLGVGTTTQAVFAVMGNYYYWGLFQKFRPTNISVVKQYYFYSDDDEEQSTYEWTGPIVGQVRDQTGVVCYNSSNCHWIIFSHTEGTIDDAVVYYPVNLPDSLKSENLSVVFSGELAEINDLPIVGGQKNYKLRLVAIQRK